MIKSISIAILLSLTSCAYNMGYTNKSLPEGHKVLSIPMFKNKTQEVSVETLFTNALTREFNRSRFARVTSKNKSKVQLLGEIRQIQYLQQTAQKPSEENLLPSGSVLITDYRIKVRVRLTLKSQEDGRILWYDDFIGDRAYSAPQITIENANSANANYNNSEQRRTLGLLAVEMMSEAHERMTENF